jgi:NadR type nicotinamide-nucleotide adenylyltransferase
METQQPAFARTARVVVTGSECTGKTSLAKFLGEQLHAPTVPEYSRTYAERVGRPLGPEDVEPIARGQMLSDDDALRAHVPIVVLDTDLVSTVVYAEHYYGSVAPWISREAQLRLGDLYLLCDIDLPWVADGIRDQPHQRRHIHQMFEKQLASWNANVFVVRGIGEAREASALAAVASWRSARAGA